MPRLVIKKIISGSSNNMPKSKISIPQKLMYLSIDIIGRSRSLANPRRKSIAIGRARRYPKAAPAEKRKKLKIPYIAACFFSIGLRADHVNAHI